MIDKEIMIHRFCKNNAKKSTGVLAESVGISRAEYEDACLRAIEADGREDTKEKTPAEKKPPEIRKQRLLFDKLTENLVEIAMLFSSMKGENEYLFERLTAIDSISWSQKFVSWVNEFEDKYPDADWGNEETDGREYYEAIQIFAREKILKDLEDE